MVRNGGKRPPARFCTEHTKRMLGELARPDAPPPRRVIARVTQLPSPLIGVFPDGVQVWAYLPHQLAAGFVGAGE